MTNFERIKNMSIEHMAELLTELADSECQKGIECEDCHLHWICEAVMPEDINANLRWLKREGGEGDG